MLGDERMTGGEAAKYLGVHRETFRIWNKNGAIQPTGTDGFRAYFSKADLDQFRIDNPDMVGRSKRSNKAREQAGRKRIAGGVR